MEPRQSCRIDLITIVWRGHYLRLRSRQVLPASMLPDSLALRYIVLFELRTGGPPALSKKRHCVDAWCCRRFSLADVPAAPDSAARLVSPIRRPAPLARHSELWQRDLKPGVRRRRVLRHYVYASARSTNLPRSARALALLRRLRRTTAHCVGVGLLSSRPKQCPPGLGPAAHDHCFRIAGGGAHRRAHQRTGRIAACAVAHCFWIRQRSAVVLGRTSRPGRPADLRGGAGLLRDSAAAGTAAAAALHPKPRLRGGVRLLPPRKNIRDYWPPNLFSWPHHQRPHAQAYCRRRCRILDSAHVAPAGTLHREFIAC